MTFEQWFREQFGPAPKRDRATVEREKFAAEIQALNLRFELDNLDAYESALRAARYAWNARGDK